MDWTTIYLAGVIGFSVILALKAELGADARFLFRLVLLWPLSGMVVALVLLMDFFGWDMDTSRTDKMFGLRKSSMFGLRKPTNPEVKGFAVTVFFCEVQFWKKA